MRRLGATGRHPLFASRLVLLALAAVLAACQAAPLSPAGKKRGGPPKAEAPRAGGPGSFVGAGQGPGLIAPGGDTGPGSGLLAPLPAGAAIVGKVKAPAGLISDGGGGLISDKGASMISNNGGSFVGGSRYALSSLEERPMAGVPVALVLANGDPVRDAAGAPIATVTGPDGAYRLPYAGSDANVLVLATLPGGKGEVLAFVPRGRREGPETVDLDTGSTLAMGYVLARYVRRDQAILEKLPAALAAETRAQVAAAIATAPPPTDLTPSQVVARVEGLRRLDAALDSQLELVRRALLAGVSNQGVGRAATDVEISPQRALRSPLGDIVWADATSARVFRKDHEGRIAVLAGVGTWSGGLAGGAGGQAASGDGGPATAASLVPAAIAYAPDGALLIADLLSGTVRRVDAAGMIATFARFPTGTYFMDLEALPDGTCRVSTPSALYSLDTAGVPTLIAGAETPGVPWMTYLDAKKAAGDGGPPAAARFGGILGIGCDPRTGDTLVFDFPGKVRRVARDVVTHVAGAGKANVGSGDGGPLEAAIFGPAGDVGVDAAGRLWIADGNSHRLRRVDDGVIETIAGTGAPGSVGDGGPARQAALGLPLAFSFGADGEVLIVADGLIRRLADGVLSTEVGALALRTDARPPGEVQLWQPEFVRFEPATGAILVADMRHIWRWRLEADTFEIVSSRGAGGTAFSEGGSARDSYLNVFAGLVVEPDGGLLYTGSDPVGSGLPLIVRQAGDRMTSVMGALHKTSITKLPAAIDAKVPFMARLARIGDEIFVATASPTPVVYVFREGGVVRRFGGAGTKPAAAGPFADYQLAGVGAFEAGPDGALYLGDNGRLLRLDPATGEASIVVGGDPKTPPADGVPAVEAQFGSLSAAGWDASGRLHIGDALLSQVWRVEAPSGQLRLVAGKGSPNLAGATLDEALGHPAGLAFDAAGDLFVADRALHQVKRVPAARLPQ